MVPFYPTYEEWKRRKIKAEAALRGTFYPTYEEWKHSNEPATIMTSHAFLSYL